MLLLLTVLLHTGLYAQNLTKHSVRWNFNDESSLAGWRYEHQDTARVPQYGLEEGNLRIFTRPYTRDRQKLFSPGKIYTAGRYRWHTYVPPIKRGEQVSIGSWIYCDDHHELDFEVGYGTKNARQSCGAKDDELVAYMTNQDHPYHSGCAAVKPGWHDYEIRLIPRNGKYLAQWLIDGKLKQEQQLQFGPEVAFFICCSVENLAFTADHIATQYYYGLFDHVSFKGQIKRQP